MLGSRVAGRYTILAEIGRGGMGIVYSAREEGRDRPIALKVLSTREFSESALRHFEQEFRTLTELSHPNLTEVYDFGRAALGPEGRSLPFFTMELVEGESLDRRPGGRDRGPRAGRPGARLSPCSRIRSPRREAVEPDRLDRSHGGAAHQADGPRARVPPRRLRRARGDAR